MARASRERRRVAAAKHARQRERALRGRAHARGEGGVVERFHAAQARVVAAAQGAWQRARSGPEATTRRELLALAVPAAAAMLGEVAIGLVDTRLVGRLGASALAGVGLATVLLYLSYALMLGLMRGVKVRTAYAVGEGRRGDAVRYAQAGVLLGVAVGVGVFFAGRDAGWALRLLGVDAATAGYAREFLAARTWGAPATCALAALVQYRQGLGDARSAMIVGLAGNALNAGLSYALIYGALGLPALGVAGAGYGTALTEYAEVLAMAWVVWSEQRRERAPARLGRRAAAREVLALGLPTGVHFVAETLAFTAFTAVLGGLGAHELAAHHLALNTIRASFLPGVALAEAASVLVGRALGAGRVDEADRAARWALLLAVGFMSACGVLFAVAGERLAGVFTQDPQVLAIARRLLLVAAVFQALDAATVVLRGALRGARDVRWVALVGTSIAWVCVPGAAWLLGRLLGWGAFGGWCGFVAETGMNAALLGWRWRHGPWRRAAPGPSPAARPRGAALAFA